MSQRYTIEVPAEDQEVLERAVESNTVDSIEDALALGYQNVVAAQLDFEDRMKNVIIPRLQELQADPSKGISAEEMKQRLRQRRAARAPAA